MPENPGNNTPKKEGKGLRGLLGGLFGGAKTQPEEEDNFRPATPLDPKPGLAGARAPTRGAVANVLNREPTESAPAPMHRAEEEKPASRPSPENNLPVKGNKLYELFCRMNEQPVPAAPGLTFNLSLMMHGEEIPGAEQRMWLKGIERELRTMPQYVSPETMMRKGEQPDPTPVDAFAFVRVAGDAMSAWVFVVPPLNSGQPLPQEWILRLLAEQDVNSGINAEAVAVACGGQYLQLIKVATGTPPTHGEDGDIVDHYARGLKIVLTVQDDGTIDFKDLGWLQTVEQGTVICDVILPTPGIPGQDVKGRPVSGREGRYKAAPMGPGTQMSDDGLALVASLDGVITFVSERFRVDPLLIVQGDVDTATGNLDVVGDVLVYGDIRDGFSVKASGSITVQGMVEAATVESGSEIRVARGVNGGGSGLMQAGGDVICKFIENATVKAGGMVISETIINSTVQSDIAVNATAGRGAIIGGSITAAEYVLADTIGNESNRWMEIILGNSVAYWQEKDELEERMEMLETEIDTKSKNIEYLSAMEEALSPADKDLLGELRTGLPMQKMQLENARRRLDILERKSDDTGACYLKARMLHPPLELTIGDIAAELRQPLEQVRVYRQGDAVQVEELPLQEF